jgi:hypothetical protein
MHVGLSNTNQMKMRIDNFHFFIASFDASFSTQSGSAALPRRRQREVEYARTLLRRLFMLRHASMFAIAGVLLLPSFISAAENRDTKVITDRTDVLATGKWIYNDLAKGFTEARRSAKPMLVVLRCIP